MKTVKKTKKAVKPVYTVDITACETGADVQLAFAYAKQKAGLAISDEELQAIVDDNSVVAIIYETATCECPKIERKPWYKRFWNWLCRK